MLRASHAANNGSWFQRTLNYLKSVPWTLTIIASTPEEPIGPAFTMAYNPSTKYLCAGGGLGASVGRNFSVGPLVVGNLQNQNAILSGASISVGAQATPLLGAQAVVFPAKAVAVFEHVWPAGRSVAPSAAPKVMLIVRLCGAFFAFLALMSLRH